MISINEVTLLGHLGKDPDCRTTQNGMAVTNLSIATNWKNSQGQESVDWHKVVLWGKGAEFARTLRKGSAICVQGALKTRTWQDQQGQKHFATEVHCQKFWPIAQIQNNQNQGQDQYNTSAGSINGPQGARQQSMNQQPMQQTAQQVIQNTQEQLANIPF